MSGIPVRCISGLSSEGTPSGVSISKSIFSRKSGCVLEAFKLDLQMLERRSRVKYRELRIEESNSIKQINAEQFIKRAWREVDGKRKLVDIDWLEKELPNGIEWHIQHFEACLKNGGKAYGCFDEDYLIGYGVIEGESFGSGDRYILLDQLFVSLECRGKGIGKTLFQMCCKGAKDKGADKLYICAGSAEETIAFYFGIGCEEAEEVNQKLYESDPRDYQLEYKLGDGR